MSKLKEFEEKRLLNNHSKGINSSKIMRGTYSSPRVNSELDHTRN